ncbi:MAG: translation initiation factor IF-3 [Clostridia bacterium]
MLINEEIREKEVRVIGKDGAQMGIMSIQEALDLAAGQNMDLALIAPSATPPTCKIMDYGKFRFEESKRLKENRKNQKVVATKEVQLSPTIDTHDFETKLRNAVKFLKSGDKVKVSVRFRGREVQHSAVGEELLERFAQGTSEVGTVDKKPKLEGRNMIMFIAPIKK